MFFWYFESRNDPSNAPLSLYVGGGPGSSALVGATMENGPCTVNSDSNSTTLNPWSWNNNVNMLYIDQPAQTGFSYNELVPANQSTTRSALPSGGVFPSQDPTKLANTTDNTARILWKFAQIWLQEFPEHKSSDDRVSLWTTSVR